MLLKRNMLQPMFNAWKRRKHVHWLEQERNNNKKRYNKAENFLRLWLEETTKYSKLHSLTKPELHHFLKHYKLSCNGRKDDWVQRISSHLLLSGVDQAMRCGNIHSNTNCKIWQKCDWRFISWWWLKWRQWRRGCLQFGRWGPSCWTMEWRGGIYYKLYQKQSLRGLVEWPAVLQLLLSTR